MTRACQSCGQSFEPKRHWQKFCSKDCKRAYHKIHGRPVQVGQMPDGSRLVLLPPPVMRPGRISS